ncbi:MAG: response regulator [Saprospiraceae bacterium]
MKKILIIEDNPDVRENLAEILELEGYEVGTAQDGKDGVEKALGNPPDLILCDVMMPELDGFGVLHILSKNPKTSDIPFLFLTAKAEKDDFRRGMSMGADDYITKPFDDVQLLQTIEVRLKKTERLRQATNQASTEGLEHFINEALAMEAIKSLSDNRELRHYRKKDPVYQEGEIPRWLYFVEKGAVKIAKTNDDGRELIVRVAAPGDFVGYMALLRDSKYPENATVLEETTLRLIPKKDFFALVFGNRDVNAQFIKLMANNMAEQEQQLLDLAYNSVRRRVATTISQLHEQGFTEIHLLREDLASLSGTAKKQSSVPLRTSKQKD